jgi:hypothetical protein
MRSAAQAQGIAQLRAMRPSDVEGGEADSRPARRNPFDSPWVTFALGIVLTGVLVALLRWYLSR